MGEIIYQEDEIIFEGIINENEVSKMREHLNLIAPKKVTFDFNKCKDIHTTILQIIVAYKALYEAEFIFSGSMSTYQKMLQGFYLSDNNIN